MESQPNNRECDKFSGRLKSICLGETDLPLEKINAYRERWGLEPLEKKSDNIVKTQTTSHPIIFNGKPRPCSACSKSKKVTLLDRVKKYAESAYKHVKDDMVKTSLDDLAFREEMCGKCPFNVNSTCELCSCPLKKNLLNDGKLSWRSESCPLGLWTKQNNSKRALVNPVHNLVFHIYPKRGAEWNWHWHIEQIKKYKHIFNGKICIGIGVDKNTWDAEDVKNMLTDVNVHQFIVKQNTKDMAETATHVELFECLKTVDPNELVFRYHTKGVTHTRDSVEQPWAELMWEVNMDLPSVHDALASHLTCGVMRSDNPLVKKNKGNYFYAGSAYWMRAKEVFERDWSFIERNRWWVEYFPSHIFSYEESACILHDFVHSSVLTKEYFNSFVMTDWANWRKAKGL